MKKCNLSIQKDWHTWITYKVNWCEELGTVLSNEEVIGGLSERGGHLLLENLCDNG